MPDISTRHPANAPGAYYVDGTCIDCDICRSIVPGIFHRSEETGTTFVARQPGTAEEVALAEQGRLECPTESIGNDGLA
jgi:ferredoxin